MGIDPSGDSAGGGGFSFRGGRLGSSTFQFAGGAVKDILGGYATAAGLRLKAQGDRVEAQNFDEASHLAYDNETFARESTAIKQVQTQRDIYRGLGETTADVAGAGFDMSGSGLDILRMGAAEGALTHQVVGAQGLIQEEAYNVQGDAYKRMAGAARMAADSEESQAGRSVLNGWITGGISAAASIATLF